MPLSIAFIDEPTEGSSRPFSGATRAGGFIFVSGRTAPIRGNPAEEVLGALSVLAEVLGEAGSDLSRVVQVTMLITDPADYEACNAEYVRHFPNGLPARHTARFGVPTDAKVGFACIALAGEA